MELLKELESNILSYGASFAGFSFVKDHLSDELKELEYAVTIGVRLSDFIIDQIHNAPTYTYFHHYRMVNSLIDEITLKTGLLLQEKGYKYFPIAASQSVTHPTMEYCGVFPHKTAAVLSGLGWIGKSGLFINPDFGPRVRLGTVLTNAELKRDNDVLKSRCGTCSICVESCPAQAIKGKNWSVGTERSDLIDAAVCSKYMMKKFGSIGRGSVCGICVKVCPFGKKE